MQYVVAMCALPLLENIFRKRKWN